MSLVNINQFQQTPVRGELDLQISKSGVISGVVSENQVGSLTAGSPVKLDATITAGNLPRFVAAAAGDLAIGYIAHNVKRDTLVASDPCEVAFFGGPVMWMVAETTIAPQDQLEQNANGNVQPLAAGSFRGIALDPGVAGGLLRVIIMTNVSAA